MKQQTKTVTFRAPKDVARSLEDAGKKTGLTTTDLIILTLRRSLGIVAGAISDTKKS